MAVDAGSEVPFADSSPLASASDAIKFQSRYGTASPQYSASAFSGHISIFFSLSICGERAKKSSKKSAEGAINVETMKKPN